MEKNSPSDEIIKSNISGKEINNLKKIISKITDGPN